LGTNEQPTNNKKNKESIMLSLKCIVRISNDTIHQAEFMREMQNYKIKFIFIHSNYFQNKYLFNNSQLMLTMLIIKQLKIYYDLHSHLLKAIPQAGSPTI
jgi:hypothetical protein